jgi:hypothetical protein
VSDFIYRAEQMVAGPGRLLAIKKVTFKMSEGSEGSGSDSSTTTTLAASSPKLDVTVTIYAFDFTKPDTGESTAVVPSASDAGSATTTTSNTE